MTTSELSPLLERRVKAVVCSGNAHKIEELSELLPSFDLAGIEAAFEMPAETENSFVGNARIKALAGRSVVDEDAWVIADDSGLAVDLLDGSPGVFSARYAGIDATDQQNVRKLLQSLMYIKDFEARTAHFSCVLVAISPDGLEFVAEGRVEGKIAFRPSGSEGFGYDPIFIPDGFDKTFAQLGDEVKSSMSHRARAANKLEQLLTKNLECVE